ncbi:MAG: OmpA family protein [Chitinophagales bacterium]|nr:OmpA family protein [Chitinophagales bacterium]
MRIKVVAYFLLGCLVISSCKTPKFEVKDGNTARELLLYNKSVDLLIKEFNAEKDIRNQQAKAFQIADSYRRFNDYANAELWYKKSLELNGDVKSLFMVAMMQKQQEKYEEAAVTFEQYQRNAPDAFMGRIQATQCREAAKWKKAFTKTQVTNAASLNSPSSDYGTEFYKNNQLVITSSRSEATGNERDGWTGEKFTDLFIAERKGKTFTIPYSFGLPVNSTAHEASVTFSKDFKEMYFVRCAATPQAANQYCHVYYTAFNNEHWSEPVKLDLFADTVNVYDPHLTPDGQTLFVAASPKDNFGGTDIYMLAKADSGWQTPKNLGTAINTNGNERFPWTDEKGNLWFSSDGLPGMGGLDIFKAVKTKTGFREPVNVRAPLNSGADDFAYRIEKYKPDNNEDTVLTSGYFSSNRKGGKGSDDIYRFEEKWVNIFVLKGKTVEKQFENAENPDSRVLGLQSLPKTRVELKATNDTVLNALFSDTAGGFIFRVDGEREYKVTASKNGYFNKTVTVSTKGLRHQDSTFIYVYTELELEKIFTQKEIVIPNIYYDYDKATLRSESKLVLDTVFIFFRENPDLTIEIGSHTDSRGSDAYNLKLSQARAQSVVDYFIQKGIPAERLLAKGYGETKLVNNCSNGVNCTEEEHQKNRRTTFRVVSAKLNLESIEPEDIKVDPKPGEEE